MKWGNFFEVWACVCGVSASISLMVIIFAAIGARVHIEGHLWLIPAVLALLTAVFGSLSAGLKR